MVNNSVNMWAVVNENGQVVWTQSRHRAVWPTRKQARMARAAGQHVVKLVAAPRRK